MLPFSFSLISLTPSVPYTSGPRHLSSTTITHSLSLPLSFQLTHVSDKLPALKKYPFLIPLFQKELTFQELNAVGNRKWQRLPCQFICDLNHKVWYGVSEHIISGLTQPFPSQKHHLFFHLVSQFTWE
ncbi:hypothetical protein V8G54_003071 [Vigna mungo]|uniref:Uncharacterized protein n=1 Tax=Vigna mungo TaxID=3915 RepID=A0AAQ3SBE5_VIGMU